MSKTLEPTKKRRRWPAVGRPLLIMLALVALNLVVYQPTRGFQFVDFDDPHYVTANAHVLAGLSWSNALWAFTTHRTPNWHPITWLSHMLDVQMFGLDAGLHHVMSAVIHAANTLLLFGWLRRVTGAIWKPAFVAALFAVHPLHVESVAWVSERKDVLSAFFWLLTLWAYEAYTVQPKMSRYLWVVVAFSLGLMSKPTVVTLPVILLLLDVWPLRRIPFSGDRDRWMRLVAEKLPLLGLALATSAVTVVLQSRAGALSSLDTLPFGERVINGVMGYVMYLYQVVWPAHLAAFYPLRHWSIWAAVLAAVGLLSVTAASVLARRSQPYLLVGWLWYLVTLLPMIGFVQVGGQAIADRYMYLPMIGLLIVIAWGVPDLARRSEWATARLVPALAVSVVIVGAWTARTLVVSWSDTVALWRHAVSNSQDNYFAYASLGSALLERGDLAGGLDADREALAALHGRWPAYQAGIHLNMGSALARQDRAIEALVEFSQASHLDPGLAEAHSGEGAALVKLGRLPEAIAAFSQALQVNPNLVEALTGLGKLLADEGKTAEARRSIERALSLDPANEPARLLLLTLTKSGR